MQNGAKGFSVVENTSLVIPETYVQRKVEFSHQRNAEIKGEIQN